MRRFPLAMAVLAAVSLPVGLARRAEGAEALLVRGETVSRRALDPHVVLPAGKSRGTLRLRQVVGEKVYDDRDLLLHELGTGKTRVVDDEVGARTIRSVSGLRTTLGALLDEVGAVALFETGGAPDLDRATVFHVFTPGGGPESYFPDPSVPGPREPDRDGDGIDDAGDNCPAVPNPDQSDTDANGIGDACQCGDVNEDGVTNVTDALGIARGEILSTAPGFGKCDVNGDGTCNVVDALQIARGEIGSSPAEQRCPTYLGVAP